MKKHITIIAFALLSLATVFSGWENVKSVFEIQNGNLIEGKHILLCDDVLTTGATTEAAIQQLIEFKDVKVSVVTLATAHN